MNKLCLVKGGIVFIVCRTGMRYCPGSGCIQIFAAFSCIAFIFVVSNKFQKPLVSGNSHLCLVVDMLEMLFMTLYAFFIISANEILNFMHFSQKRDQSDYGRIDRRSDGRTHLEGNLSDSTVL